jgi:hypothetical protein
MARPVPAPIAPSEVLDRAREVIRADRFPVLATLDGDHPRVRPVSPVRTDGFTIYVRITRLPNSQRIPAWSCATWMKATIKFAFPALQKW